MSRKLSDSITAQFQTPTQAVQNSLVQEIVLGVAGTQVTFSNLDGISDKGYILECELVGNGSTDGNVALYVNGDTTAGNYNQIYLQHVAGDGTGVVSEGAQNLSSITYLYGSGYGQVNAAIRLIRGLFSTMANTWMGNSTASKRSSGVYSIEKIAAITNITQLDIVCGVNMGIGSRFRLYRRNTAPNITLTAKNLNNLVEQKIITVDTSSITFTGLDSLSDGDYTLLCNIVNAGAVSDDIQLFVNGDATKTNYLRQEYGVSASNTSQVTSGADAAIAWPPPGYMASAQVRISCVNGFFSAISQVTEYITTTTAQSRTRNVRKNVAIGSISSLTVLCSSGANMTAGSVFTLYKANGAQQLVPYSPTDITSRTTDYPLKAGEVVFLSYTAVTNLPLNIAIQEGEYELTITGNLTASVANSNNVGLAPNNRSISSVVRQQFMADSGLIGSFTNQNSNITSDTSMVIGEGLVLRANLRVSTTTVCKTIEGKLIVKTPTVYQTIYLPSIIWTDTTTPWTSLGTLAFPFAQSGIIHIKRIL